MAMRKKTTKQTKVHAGKKGGNTKKRGNKKRLLVRAPQASESRFVETFRQALEREAERLDDEILSDIAGDLGAP